MCGEPLRASCILAGAWRSSTSVGGRCPSLREARGGTMAGRRVQAIAEGRPGVFARERGFVRTRDLTAIGIPRRYLARMCDEGLLEKVTYGHHRAADGVNKRPKLTPPSFGISMAWLAD